MTLTLISNVSAIGPNLTTYFLASGGTTPYSYSVIADGAGGSINSTSGKYSSPISVNSSPHHAYDTIQVTDAVSATATKQILVGTPLILFCKILQNKIRFT